MRWSDAVRTEVVDTSTAESIGHVYGAVIDPSRSCITGVVVGHQIVELTRVGGVGADALTVPSRDLLRDPRTDAEHAATEGVTNPLSKPVYTEDGFELGPLEDLEFDAETGEIAQLLLADDEVAGNRLLGVGSFAVVVSSSDGLENDGDLAHLTKGELYERAQARDIEGRSTMSKDELIAALR